MPHGFRPHSLRSSTFCTQEPMHSRSETVPLKPQFQSRNRISVQKPRVGATSPCHEPGTVIDRADLILEVGYFCADSGLFKKRVVVCEVDGDDKTKHSDTEYNEVKTQITRPQNDPIKLALKLMSSTVAQNAIQSETCHIRANYAWYNTDAIQKSLLSTTTHDLHRPGEELSSLSLSLPSPKFLSRLPPFTPLSSEYLSPSPLGGQDTVYHGRVPSLALSSVFSLLYPLSLSLSLFTPPPLHLLLCHLSSSWKRARGRECGRERETPITEKDGG